jgi:hypothetical protein
MLTQVESRGPWRPWIGSRRSRYGGGLSCWRGETGEGRRGGRDIDDAAPAQRGRGDAVRAWGRDVILPILVTRALLVLAAFLSILAIPLSRYVPTDWTILRASPLVDAFNRWDATNYLRIAADGYTTAHPGDAAFFPLFPVLVNAVASITGSVAPDRLSVAALVVANLALVAAVSGLVALARLDFDAQTARRAGWVLVVFPTALFLSAGYAESTFLALSIWAYLACRAGRWPLAGLLCAGAALTRPFGILVVLPLAVEWVFQWRDDARPKRSHIAGGLAALGVVAAGVVTYLAILEDRLGDPLAFIHAQVAWSRGLVPPWVTLGNFFSQDLTFNRGEHDFVDLAFTLILIVLVALSWRVLRPALALFATSLLVVFMSTGSLLSMPRFVLAAFPVFLVLARAARNATFERAYLVLGAGLGAVWMALFAAWYWVS